MLTNHPLPNHSKIHEIENSIFILEHLSHTLKIILHELKSNVALTETPQIIALEEELKILEDELINLRKHIYELEAT